MRSFLLVAMACAGLLAGCGLIDRSATPAESEASFQDRAAAVAKAWQDGGIATAWATGFVPLQELTVEPAWTPNGDLKASYGNGWNRPDASTDERRGGPVGDDADPPGDDARPQRPCRGRECDGPRRHQR